ncbi:hypothetical protein QE152_g8689 [Popillia japonica]|uniref:SGNH hydrolase-type esterase domain-containing protein n=1 Tax=Popillia japonica TaxID=7064 RepID=A0AAW1M1U3_POPJA
MINSITRTSYGRRINSDSSGAEDFFRVLILGDSHCRGMANIYNDSHIGSHTAESLFKPNARIEDVVQDATHLTAQFTIRHHVVIFAGTNNILRGSLPTKEFFRNIIKQLSHTNAIFVSVPFCQNKKRFAD